MTMAEKGGAAPRRRLWLCADDYGISPAVSRAIRDLIGRGRLNATSVMVTAPAFSAAEAQALAECAWVDRRAAIGLHFTLTAPFRPASPRFRPAAQDGAFLNLPRTFALGLLRRFDPAALEAEAESQFAAFRAAFGRPPDYVDGHQHVQLLPQVSDALLAVMKRWQRRSDPKGLLLDALSARLRRRCARHGVATNPGFAGTYDFTRARTYGALFASFLKGLPDGGVVMCHPGFVDAELQRLDDFTAMREQEHAFFAGDTFPQVLAAHRMELAQAA
jgi:predicted glycoside hydrolase/deacetylase ChbG (UPF0249 family)